MSYFNKCKLSLLFSLEIIFLFSSVVNAVVIPNKNDKVVHLNLEKRVNTDLSPIEAALSGSIELYVDLEIGTPEQHVRVLFDTEAADTWVTSPSNPLCKNSTVCVEYGTYEAKNSSTYKLNSTLGDLRIDTEDYSLNGTWVQDTVRLGDLSVENFVFGVANESDIRKGVLGVGFESLEVSGNSVYPNFPQALKDGGYINKKAYSLFTNSYCASEGSVIFGAVDASKYTGDLYTLPLVNGSDSTDFTVALQGLGVITAADEKVTIIDTPTALVFDNTETTSTFPTVIADAIAALVNATYTSDGIYHLTCPDESDASTIVLDFGGVHIYIPIISFIAYDDDADACYLGFFPPDDDDNQVTSVLGGTILQDLYVVYDLESYEISIAHANLAGVNESDVQVITSTIPGATKVPGYSSTSVATNFTTGGNIFTLSSEPINPWLTTEIRGCNQDNWITVNGTYTTAPANGTATSGYTTISSSDATYVTPTSSNSVANSSSTATITSKAGASSLKLEKMLFSTIVFIVSILF
ncbi:uncharacterized protein SCODWIG_01553 [Saccharomycodes ludwigii]|uniref:Peptidase A1 domain-containing protein n=1 Tax=Saccharomycodes ludwigii TaxID=36035 RepID=A0A376B592_9ASCO|nr:hypothetical protein SCDLUD_000074 [Saccharomycodes ludwigii]KAH3902497.1 hypothetical protein SCDLUD_000074 [Saccharomycodes ludwigii]SSD59792.1 uncharacterized protein SCODWIG_01553 [Saccharomycodes ludwigii]